jgi:hypothetical protein
VKDHYNENYKTLPNEVERIGKKFVDMGSCYVIQACLKLLDSKDDLVSAS